MTQFKKHLYFSVYKNICALLKNYNIQKIKSRKITTYIPSKEK